LTLLYSFRRCPYAMRARMALSVSGLPVRVREIVLRDKPAEMLAASPKGTVPVLVPDDGPVIDESLDIMRWALAQTDPEGWLAADAAETNRLIAQNDGTFKQALDRYKYPGRHGDDAATNRDAGMEIIRRLSDQLAEAGGQLFGPAPTLADYAIFPFVRQFAATDSAFWQAHAPQPIQQWLEGHVAHPRFLAIMAKLPRWQAGGTEPLLTELQHF